MAFEEAERLFDLEPPGDANLDQLPELERLRPLAQLAREADDYWSEELPAFRPVQKGQLGLVTLSGFYTAVYRHLSRAAHAEVETSDPVVRLTEGQLVVTSEERIGRVPDDTLALAIPITSLALVVYAHQFGVLDREAIHRLNQSLGAAS